MKLRYQMRGLGIGMIVTALLMGVALDDKRPLSDAEIKLLAAELGMVEADSLKLSDVQQNTSEPTSVPTEEPIETPTSEPTAEPTEEPTAEPTETPTTEPTEAPTAEPTSEPASEATKAPAQDVTGGEMVTIVVNRGANSYSVSKQLAEAGLVENAGAYDRYLCNNGYAERIQVGTFEIPMGSSQEEIAKIITKTR